MDQSAVPHLSKTGAGLLRAPVLTGRVRRTIAAESPHRGREGRPEPSLVLRGEARDRQDALLDYAAGSPTACGCSAWSGRAEAEIPFAGLQLLFARFADRFDGLPGPQALALRAALGASASSGERLLVGAAVLTLLSELAEDGPVLCLVDDVQWFDRSSIDALLLAARRLHTDPVAVVFGVRDGDRPFPAAGVDSLTLRRLDRTESARLLAGVRTLPGEIAERVLDESGGNPLAILELAATDGPFHRPAPVPASRDRRWRSIPGLIRRAARTHLAWRCCSPRRRPSELRSFSDAAVGLARSADLSPPKSVTSST